MRGIDWSRAYSRSQVFSRSRCLIDLTTDGPALSNSKAAIPGYLNRVMMRAEAEILYESA
jgi:hypothetical protein